MTDENPYILGTESAELHRLGVQHQAWSEEANKGWRNAGFNKGNRLLDLGSGPGFCSKEMAYLVGTEGSIVALDKSENYIEFLNKTKAHFNLPIETVCSDFSDYNFGENQFDGAYCRWALAWLSDPEAIIKKVAQSLKPGGSFVAQEYFDWSTHQVVPRTEHLATCIAGCLKSFKESDGEIDIGRHLPEMFEDAGLEIISIRPLTKIVTPEDASWQWPTSFYEIYFPKVAEMGYYDKETVRKAMEELEEISADYLSMIFCPSMVEVIGVKL